MRRWGINRIVTALPARWSTPCCTAADPSLGLRGTAMVALFGSALARRTFAKDFVPQSGRQSQINSTCLFISGSTTGLSRLCDAPQRI
jgi:hypothetical protein